MIPVITLVFITLWKPMVGSIVFIIFFVLLESLIYILHLSKIKFKNTNNEFSEDEVAAIEHYHLFFKYPFASRMFSRIMSGVQLSVFILVPWLVFKGLYIQGLIIGINYFIAPQLAVSLNPQFFLHDNLDKGKVKDPDLKSTLTSEMLAIDSALEKMYLKIKS